MRMSAMLVCLAIAGIANAQDAHTRRGENRMFAIVMMLQTAAAPAPVTVPAKAAAEKKYCRPMVLTGSIMPGRRMCLTRAEWAKFDGSTEAAWERARYTGNRSYSRPPGGN